MYADAQREMCVRCEEDEVERTPRKLLIIQGSETRGERRRRINGR